MIVNADDLLLALEREPGVDTRDWPRRWSVEDLLEDLASSSLARRSALELPSLRLRGHHLGARGSVDAYHAAALADWLRRLLLRERRDFTFETVMSHPGKVAFLHQARAAGYRVYLYWVVTEDAEVNVDRVAQRVREGGHAVPPDKIRRRYVDALELLRPAMETSDRAYLFDNSSAGGPQLVAEWEHPGPTMKLHCSAPGPVWLEYAELRRRSG